MINKKEELVTDSHSKELVKKIVIYVPSKIFPAFLSLAFTAIFTRVFSTGSYGKYSLMLSIATLVVAILSQWLQQSINRYFPGAKAKEKDKLREIIGLGFIFIIGVILILAVIGWIIVEHLFPNWSVYYISSILFILAYSLFNPLRVIFQADMQANKFTKYSLFKSILRFGISVGLVFLVFKKTYNLLLGTALGGLFLVPFLWCELNFPSFSNILSKKKIRSRLVRLKKLFNYGLPMTGWFLVATILNVGDRYIIQWFKGASQVGLYSANYRLINGTVGLMTAPIVMAVHPFLMRAWENSDKEKMSKWLEVIIEYFFIGGILLISGVWLFSKDIAFYFLGSQFRKGHIIMPVVIGGIIIWQMGMYFHKPLEFVEKTKVMFKLGLITAIINILLNILLIPKFGYIAAAYTTLISFIFYAIIAAVIGKKIINWKINWKKIINYFFLILPLVLGLRILRIKLFINYMHIINFVLSMILFCGIIIIIIGLEHFFNKNKSN
ncbi:membrane protein involved in the export of O-antigen and teichoic acid [Halobacteroides halobius DSM 5150]|uniref:Membrane protein involved in the export of O-antigen and teichoic acid n=1 Tax=Halobacteroides halobius (strain ATCC 35273 / DSM 5150 / MD-1) TaxID=748449 RepID=L0KCI3_HALHC|nr:lipopolysaccharide biosynthesis protein [Halobacteroides halobius]AGB42260.1 membrane protein involved in the export of O-antigen and teichoic acid [Halobacteroides halobius DSM 5150]